MFTKKIPTLNANIFHSVWSKFMKILPHDLRQIKYKILWLYSKKNVFFVFLDEHNKNSGFEQKNGLGPSGVKVSPKVP